MSLASATHLSQHVKVWRVAADSSYVWLRLSRVKVNGSEMCLCVYYMAPSSSTVNTGTCPYDTLQNDIVDSQNAGRYIIVCGGMNARTAATRQSNVCPVELAAQFEAFRALMGYQPAQIPEQEDLLGTSVLAADASCFNPPITADELHDCIKHLNLLALMECYLR